MATGYPGYTGIIPKSTATIAEILRDNGYATAMFGKAHNTPETEISPAGPFDNWPTGQGFDYFYGFNQGETNQYFPTLYRDTTPVPQPKTPEQGYQFSADMTDEAIAWIGNEQAADPEKPWFVYFSTPGVHAPHQVTQEWRDKYKGKFDYGWDKQRELTYAKQLEMGIIPKGTKLTPRPDSIPAWDDQSEDAKKVYTRLMENYAAYMAYTDYQVGRLIDSLAASGQLDNTLVLYVVGDNGASAEGGLEGTFSEVASLLGVQLGLESTIKRIDEIGGPTSEPHVPVGWAWAMDAPFQWTKQVASHFGGTRNPLVVHWPKGIKAKGEIRTQFHHVIDIVPTILEATKIPEPKVVKGIPQKPIEGVSMRYSFDDATAKDRRTTQYFEMLTNRAIYDNGWVAASRFGVPWQTAGREGNFLDAPWELYNVNEDFSEAVDLAAKNPDKLKELQAKFEEEAEKYNVYPLEFTNVGANGSIRGLKEFTYYDGMVRIPEGGAPDLKNKSFGISAVVDIPEGGAEGLLMTQGGRFAGVGLYLLEGRPVFHYNLAGVERYTVAGKDKIPPGRHVVTLDFNYDGGGVGKGGQATLTVDGNKVASEHLPQTIAYRMSLDETLDIGEDTGTPISEDYKVPFKFTGKLDKVTINITEEKLTEEQLEQYRQGRVRSAIAQ